jgi:hypothetical protein
MKRTIKALLLATLVLVPGSVASYGQGVAKTRAKAQQARIHEGVQDGSLTAPEAAALKQDQRQIRRQARRAKADGVVTTPEAARLANQQNQASRRIAKQKHDAQVR